MARAKGDEAGGREGTAEGQRISPVLIPRPAREVAALTRLPPQPGPEPARRRLVADLALLLVCLVWGSTFVIVKEAVAEVPTMTFLALRFTLATLALAIVFGRDVVAGWRRLAGPGVLVGLFLWSGYTFQTIGLQFTEASRAGFITGLAVVLVPAVSAVLLKERPSAQAMAGVGLALGGLALMFLVPSLPAAGGLGATSGPEPAAASRMVGDFLVLGCAVCFALHIVSLGRASSTRARTAREAGALATIQVGAATLGYLAAVAVEGIRGGSARILPYSGEAGALLAPSFIWALVITGLLATAGAFLVQTAAQRHTSATHTALIFASEPVFAALFGWLWLGERLVGWPLVGCLLILAGMVVAELPAAALPGRHRTPEQPTSGPGSN